MVRYKVSWKSFIIFVQSREKMLKYWKNETRLSVIPLRLIIIVFSSSLKRNRFPPSSSSFFCSKKTVRHFCFTPLLSVQFQRQKNKMKTISRLCQRFQRMTSVKICPLIWVPINSFGFLLLLLFSLLKFFSSRFSSSSFTFSSCVCAIHRRDFLCLLLNNNKLRNWMPMRRVYFNVVQFVWWARCVGLFHVFILFFILFTIRLRKAFFLFLFRNWWVEQVKNRIGKVWASRLSSSRWFVCLLLLRYFSRAHVTKNKPHLLSFLSLDRPDSFI